MDKIDIAGLSVNPITKKELLSEIATRIKRGEKTFLTTLYSEFLYWSMRDYAVRDLLNRADMAVADGVAVIWANHFLTKRFRFRAFYFKIVEGLWEMGKGALSLLSGSRSYYGPFSEKIVGADLIWDLADLAQQNNFKIFLLGGFGDTPKIVKHKLTERFPKLNVVGYSNHGPEDERVLGIIKHAQPDMVLVAYGPLKQESWIDANLDSLPVKFAVGLGGTFDYIAGMQPTPPAWLRQQGLEWLYRLVTQPHRLRRIMRSVFGLLKHLLRYKVFQSCSYRSNAAAIVVNDDNEVLLCQRNPKIAFRSSNDGYQFDYWQFPQGGLEPGEEIVVGAKRELREETGIRNVRPLATAEYLNYYNWHNALRPLLGQRMKYRGQRQHTVFFRFHGSDQEIVLDKRELVNFRWCTIEEAVTLVAPERKPHATAVLNELKKLLV